MFLVIVGRQYAEYLSHQYGFHDLALINDFLASIVWHGRWFHVFALNLNHLSVHFTPTLALISPVYRLFDSQFILVVMVTMAMFAGSYFQYRLYAIYVLKNLSHQNRWYANAFFGLACFLNVFVWNVLSSPHFEVFYFPLVSCLFFCLLTRNSRWLCLSITLLALGIRQDSGLTLFFQLAAVAYFAYKQQRLNSRLPIILSLMSLAYFVLASVWIMPQIGAGAGQHVKRLWQEWGTTIPDILMAMLSDPLKLLTSLSRSAWLSIILSFGAVMWASPVVAALVYIPALLMFTMSTSDRYLLLWYNSSFVLAGFFFATSVGLSVLLQNKKFNLKTPHILLAGIICIALGRLIGSDSDSQGSISSKRMKESLDRIAFIDKNLADCRSIETLASDFVSISFLPNRYGKFLLNHYGNADGVFLFSNGHTMLSGVKKMDDLIRRMPADSKFKLVNLENGSAFYVKHSVFCNALTKMN
jgi:uncharacterized membrane protein